MSLCPWGTWVWNILRGQDQIYLRTTRGPLADHRGSRFLMIFWHRLGTPFLSILVLTWPQLGPQLGPKIVQKSIQEPSKIHPNLHLVFDRFLDRFLIDFRPQNRPKINQKSIKTSSQQHNNQKTKMLKFHKFLQYNRALGYVMLSTKINQNRPNINQNTDLKFMLQFGPILEPT